MVMARHQDHAFEILKCVVERLDRFQVEVVGGGIEYHCVGVGEHHSGYHAADFLASGKNRSLLSTSSPLKSILPRNPLRYISGRVVAPLAEPVHKVEVGLEEFRIVERQIRGGDGLSPVVIAGIRFAASHDDLEEGGHGAWVAAQESHLVSLLYLEIHIGE